MDKIKYIMNTLRDNYDHAVQDLKKAETDASRLYHGGQVKGLKQAMVAVKHADQCLGGDLDEGRHFKNTKRHQIRSETGSG